GRRRRVPLRRLAVAIELPVVWTDAHRLHEPGAEIWIGVRTPSSEIAERVERIRAAVEEAGARVMPAEPHTDEALLDVHAAELVLAGAPAASACCRPPGHHVTRTAYGGSCYLNSSAVAAQHLRREGVSRVALVDVDAHHGNGAQAIFWDRDDVLTGSIHVDPGAGWFPHYLGFANERGGGPGEGATLTVLVPPGQR